MALILILKEVALGLLLVMIPLSWLGLLVWVSLHLK